MSSDAVACVSFNIFTISLEPACILSGTCSRIFACEYVRLYICCGCIHMYIEMGPTQTSEGKERFPAS